MNSVRASVPSVFHSIPLLFGGAALVLTGWGGPSRWAADFNSAPAAARRTLCRFFFRGVPLLPWATQPSFVPFVCFVVTPFVVPHRRGDSLISGAALSHRNSRVKTRKGGGANQAR